MTDGPGPAAATHHLSGGRGRSRGGGGRRSGRGGRLRERRSTCTLVSQEGLTAAGCCSLVLSDQLRAVHEVLFRVPRVVCRSVALVGAGGRVKY